MYKVLYIHYVYIRVTNCRNYESALPLTRRRGTQIYRRFGRRGLPVPCLTSCGLEIKCSSQGWPDPLATALCFECRSLHTRNRQLARYREGYTTQTYSTCNPSSTQTGRRTVASDRATLATLADRREATHAHTHRTTRKQGVPERDKQGADGGHANST